MVDALDILDRVLSEHSNHTKWNDTRFGEIKILANTLVGSVGQKFTEMLCGELDISYQAPLNAEGQKKTQNPWDLKISDIEFEIKTATEDTSGNFQFNHIRYHREYQALLCIGISPDNVFFDMWSKAEVTVGDAGKLVSMEKDGNASHKLTKRKAELRHISEFNNDLVELAANLQSTRRIRN